MFSDNAGTVAGTSVVLDSRGEPTTFKLIWLNTAVIYKFVLKDSTGTTIWTIDNISGDDGTGNTASSVFDQQTLTATAGQTLFTLGYSYVTGTNAMAVYKNGARLITGTDFTETSSTSVTLTMAAISGDEYTFIGGQDVSSSFSGTNVSFIQAGTGAVQRNVQNKLRESVSVKDFGADSTGVSDSTTAIWNAIISLRANAVSILDTIGGSTITAYSSGTVYFPPGIYKIAPDQLNIYQDVGLTIKGAGSRRTNNSVRASTTLLISGTSSGFGIRAYRNGGRGLTIEDIDICYETSAFTGSVVDVVDAPGLTLTRVMLGTYGLTAGTRLQTAAACIRSTYDEFMTFNTCVFDGAVRGWWSDDTRTELANTFGGSVTSFKDCVFYDFSQNMVYHGGTRTREAVTFDNCAFNCISVSPSSSGINVDNVDGLNIKGCIFQPSTTNAPASQWLRATNCTAVITGNILGDLAPSMYASGTINISNNKFAGTAGPTLVGGVITGSGNEFSTGSGWLVSTPALALCVNLGPDLFKAAITYSYDIPADSASYSGCITYDRNNDSSVNKFRNTSERINIQSNSDRLIGVSSTPYTASILDTGNTILATGGSNQAFTLPAPVPGTRLTISKISSVDLSVTCSAGTNYYGVGSTFPTAAALTGAAMGTIELEAYATVGWIVKSQVST
ncbi:MAG: hypothetical protein ING20_10610, partial [Burkholderiales bacterium]|nr:hypothetical protein [Burkholderiales bacterium]